ncbi:hypothetical protein Tco_0870507 [Tanacetum coccineum]
MGGSLGRAYAVDGGIRMGRVFKTRPRRRRVKQSGEIDIEFKTVDEYSVKVNKIKETDIREKDKKSSQKRQNRAQNGKAWKSQSQIKANVQESQSQVNLEKSTVKPDPEDEEILKGPSEPI